MFNSIINVVVIVTLFMLLCRQEWQFGQIGKAVYNELVQVGRQVDFFDKVARRQKAS